jgi:uncharacterized repeat protein (TIGR01451 family)
MTPPTRLRALVLRLAAFVGLCLAGLLAPGHASAQTAFTYTNSTTTTIDGSRICTSPVVRTFNVTDNFTVGDVDLGVYATHSWRGDLRITLQAPDGTRVQLVDGDATSTSGDNFNVRLDDSAVQLVNTDSPTGNHAASMPPPFDRTYSPNSPLAAFAGMSSVGSWRVEVCDIFPSADNGVLRYVALYLTSIAPGSADLSLTKTVNVATPTAGQNVTFTLNLLNASFSGQTASASVTDLLPPGLTYVSHSGNGTYNPATGLWTPTAIAPGQTRTLSIVATVNATSGAVITNAAEIASSNRPDIDSTPGNGITTEDDYATASVTVSGTRVAGTAPVLVCSAGTIPFNWTGRTWTAGSTANNYTLAGFGAFNWSINSPAAWMNEASIGGQQPALTTSAQNILSLSKGIDFANRSQVAVTTVTLGEIVDGAQFTIFDVDYAPNDFADWVRVTGTLGGVTTVIPVLTNGIANYVIGNAAFGDVGSDPLSANGNVIVTFNQPIDTIIIEYGNHSLAPADPDGQAIQMAGGITICTPDADIEVTKTSEVLSDEISAPGVEPFAVPGARLRYCIMVRNNGSATASGVTASDTLPSNLTYQAGTIRSGTTCETAAVVEDDDASDGAEVDAIRASHIAGVIAFTVTTLANGQTAAVTFEALID